MGAAGRFGRLGTSARSSEAQWNSVALQSERSAFAPLVAEQRDLAVGVALTSRGRAGRIARG